MVSLKYLFALTAVILPFFSLLHADEEGPTIVSTRKIWSQATHSAFTDLIRYHGQWYCVFRESDEHVGGSGGQIRIIASRDGDSWKSICVFVEEGVDLRDPKLSVTADDRLMLLAGGSEYSKGGSCITRQPRTAFSDDGRHWSELTKILEPHEWLWRVTWHHGKAYGVSYRSSHLAYEDSDWIATLFESDDGLHFRKITQLQVPGFPSEATLHFLETGEMIALIRRGENAWIGVSQEPFVDWMWHDATTHLGGPNFVILPDQSMWASGRGFEKNPAGEVVEKMMLGEMTLDGIANPIVLPSGGDTSYPGMVYHGGMLWISYYSSHEEDKAAIYLAKVIPKHIQNLRKPRD